MIHNDISQAITKSEELMHVHLEPSKGWAPLKVRERWEYRELFYFLTWRDVKVRYKQTALVPWAFFANSVTQSSNSLVTNGNLIKKVYFPRLVIPIAGVFGGFIDFALAFVVLIGMMLAYGFAPTVNIVWLPLLFLLAVDLNLHG